MLPDTLHFVRPEWLIAIPLAVAIALLWSRRRGASSQWEARIDPELQSALIEPAPQQHRVTLPWLLAGGLIAGAFGLAGPSWERLPQPVQQRSDALVVILDLSLSMFAEDVAPSRLVRARQKAADVLRLRREGLTGLVVYAGNAHTVVPLTDDVRTIENLLPVLSPDMMPVFGSNPGEAVDLARELFRTAGLDQGRILLVTDGVDRMTALTERRQRSFPISILGVGTPAGGTIPLHFDGRPGEVLTTRQGEPILARLDDTQLAEISRVTYGRYRTLGIGDEDILALLETPLPGPEELRDADREFDLWADRGYWAALVLAPLLLLAFRRGTFVLVPLLLMPLPADAGVWDDLWARRDQQAYRLVRDGEPERAAALFRDPDWRAAALYRSGEFEQAAEHFRSGESTRHLYNLGNALALQGDYAGALAAYDEVLEHDPAHSDALWNRALVEKLAQAAPAGEHGESREDAGHGDPDSSVPPQGQMPREPASEDTAADEPADGSPAHPEEALAGSAAPDDGAAREDGLEELRDESREALEQWLRRVPDDPGGLLRRKFQYETQQRLRRGEYRAREPEKIW
jgi:Ca-activated chloride channel homolog